MPPRRGEGRTIFFSVFSSFFFPPERTVTYLLVDVFPCFSSTVFEPEVFFAS